MTKVRTYTELSRYSSFEFRYDYLKLDGFVGRSTFGFDRYLNQKFYMSREWRNVRRDVILRDESCDMGVPGFEIHRGLYIHHMNPIQPKDIVEGSEDILNPEFLITVTHATHNAIHFGTADYRPNIPVIRYPGDTTPWRKAV